MKKPITKSKMKYNALYLCLMIGLATLTIFNISFYLYSKPEIAYVVKDPISSRISFWQTFLASHPTYFEGWIELSKLKMENGDISSAEFAFQNAWRLNPNSV